ncbi:hypothetical protein QFZ27_004783 [Inquilinus ginsengisoli]|uniref:hypothetical protein n=1 Tax=Inquilinus ginsengisoli TaxID=363840 RepID=UPI003D258E1E
MKTHLVLALSAFLSGCQGSNVTPSAQQSPQGLDTKSEYLQFSLPKESKVGYEAHSPSLHIVEYVKLSESVEQWTAMITIIIQSRSSYSDLNDFFQIAPNRLRAGCAVEATVESPKRFFDGPYPAGIQTAICGRTKGFGQAEILILKAIEGKYGIYQMQYAWRLPPVADSRDIMFPEHARRGATEALAQAQLCDRERPRPEC